MSPDNVSDGSTRRDFLKQSVVTAGALGAAGAVGEGPTARAAAADGGQEGGPMAGSRSGLRRTYNGEYRGEFTDRVAFPLGGIGAGMICLEGAGALSHVSLRHRPDVFNEPPVFAAICVKGKPNVARVLEGPVPRWKIFGPGGTGNGAPGKTYGLPRCAEAVFTARFPFATIALSDPKVPLAMEITGWSPFEPGDADNASLPVAALEYRFTNTTNKPIEAVFSFNARNFMAIGPDGHGTRRIDGGFVIYDEGGPNKQTEQGALSVSVSDPAAKVNCAWFRGGWWDPLTMAWKDVREGSAYDREPPSEGGPAPGASLFVPFSLAPGASKTIALRLAWYVGRSDQRHGNASDPVDADGKKIEPEPYKAWYAGRFRDIDDVTKYWRDRYDALRAGSARFRDSFYDSTLPPEVLEAVAANLAIIKSPTVLRQADGRLWCWEGCSDGGGCCYGSCTHVWNYAQAIPHLFPSLERTLRETEFEVSQDDKGHQAFRVPLPIRAPVHDFHSAADGQLGGIMKVHREWRVSGDTAWLRRLWPAVKKSMDYCIETWDPQHKGAIEEPHHNTYDIEFWGPDGMCTSFYLGALRAASLMGKALGEDVQTYETLLDKGTRYCNEQLYNGEYYIQKIEWRNLHANDPVKEKTFSGGYSTEAKALLEEEGPKYQYGNGCLADGVLGAWLALICGVGEVLDRAKVVSHLRSVHKYNLKHDLSEHTNPQRPSYACGAEGGLLLCTWPHGDALSLPFVYSDEVWTGIEYQVASHLMLMGHVNEGLEIVRVCRDRYDGRVRNPFNEYECGHWYARAMSSYGLLQGLSGVRYDAVDKVLYVEPNIRGDFRSFLSTATGYGVVGVKDGKPFVEVRAGSIDVRETKYTPASA